MANDEKHLIVNIPRGPEESHSGPDYDLNDGRPDNDLKPVYNPYGGYGVNRPGPGPVKAWPGSNYGGPPPGWNPRDPGNLNPGSAKQDTADKQKEKNDRDEAAKREQSAAAEVRERQQRERETTPATKQPNKQ
jgi:hypothetical protein